MALDNDSASLSVARSFVASTLESWDREDRDNIIPLLTSARRLQTMSTRAADLGRRDADEKMVDMIIEASNTPSDRAGRPRGGRGR